MYTVRVIIIRTDTLGQIESSVSNADREIPTRGYIDNAEIEVS